MVDNPLVGYSKYHAKQKYHFILSGGVGLDVPPYYVISLLSGYFENYSRFLLASNRLYVILLIVCFFVSSLFFEGKTKCLL